MPTVSRLFVAAAFLLLAGGASGAPAKAPPRQTTITVMTRNLYLGANLDPIVHATSPQEAFRAVAAGWAQVQANDFNTRANAVAATRSNDYLSAGTTTGTQLAIAPLSRWRRRFLNW